jgi:preprotein translocase subunit SecE
LIKECFYDRSVAQLVERRSPKPEVGGSIPFAPAIVSVKVMGKILRFIYEVKQELGKVSWLTRKETLISTGIVLLVVLVFSIFFVLSDFVIFHFVKFISSIRF